MRTGGAARDGEGAWTGRLDMNVMGLAVLTVLALLLYRYIEGRRPKKRERSEIKQLMVDCDGDQDLVERLIFVEMEQQPELSFAEAARRARKRLARDRH